MAGPHPFGNRIFESYRVTWVGVRRSQDFERRRDWHEHGIESQSGLPQNNRVGDLDSFALPFLMRALDLSLEEAEKLMCKESGLKALSGGYNDFRDIEEQSAKGNRKAQLALEVFVHEARRWIGSYYLD